MGDDPHASVLGDLLGEVLAWAGDEHEVLRHVQLVRQRVHDSWRETFRVHGDLQMISRSGKVESSKQKTGAREEPYEIDPELGVHLVQDLNVVNKLRRDLLLGSVDVADLHSLRELVLADV